MKEKMLPATIPQRTTRLQLVLLIVCSYASFAPRGRRSTRTTPAMELRDTRCRSPPCPSCSNTYHGSSVRPNGLAMSRGPTYNRSPLIMMHVGPSAPSRVRRPCHRQSCSQATPSGPAATANEQVPLAELDRFEVHVRVSIHQSAVRLLDNLGR